MLIPLALGGMLIAVGLIAYGLNRRGDRNHPRGMMAGGALALILLVGIAPAFNAAPASAAELCPPQQSQPPITTPDPTPPSTDPSDDPTPPPTPTPTLPPHADPIVVTPVAPTLTEPDCGEEATVVVPEVEGLTHTEVRDGDTVTITFAPASDDFVLEAEVQATWNLTIPAIIECPVDPEPTEVIPVAPTLSSPPCDEEAIVVVTPATGIRWNQVRTGDTVTVTATAQDASYVIAAGAQTTWNLTIPAIIECPVDPPLEPAIALVKRAASLDDVNGNGLIDAGDLIFYEFDVTNTGELEITDLVINDDKLAGITVTCDDTTLAIGAVTTCTADAGYVITAGDAAAGSVVNTATASGSSTGGDITSNDDSTTTVVQVAVPALVLDKRVARVTDENDNQLTDAGDLIYYEFDVENTGELEVTDLVINDDKLSGITVTCDDTTLAIGATTTCRAEAGYVITTADQTAAIVTNKATATGSTTGGDVTSNEDSTSTPVQTPPVPALRLTKTVARIDDVNKNGLTDEGDLIVWNFSVENTGETMLTSITVADDMLDAAGITVTCDPSFLSIGGTTTCTPSAGYPITASDAARGTVINTATASGDDPWGDPVDSPESTTETPTVVAVPALELTKEVLRVDDVNDSGSNDAGDLIWWTFRVENTGELAITDLTINDDMLATTGIAIDCPDTDLDIGEFTVCTALAGYVITAEDAAAYIVTNTAIASGDDSNGNNVDSNESQTSTIVPCVPSIAFEAPDDGVPIVAISDEEWIYDDEGYLIELKYTATIDPEWQAAFDAVGANVTSSMLVEADLRVSAWVLLDDGNWDYHYIDEYVDEDGNAYPINWVFTRVPVSGPGLTLSMDTDAVLAAAEAEVIADYDLSSPVFAVAAMGSRFVTATVSATYFDGCNTVSVPSIDSVTRVFGGGGGNN